LLRPFRSTGAPPAAAHYPLTEEGLANGDAVLAETVLLGGYRLKADPPGPFRVSSLGLHQSAGSLWVGFLLFAG
jgi:hypothetical protein